MSSSCQRIRGLALALALGASTAACGAAQDNVPESDPIVSRLPAPPGMTFVPGGRSLIGSTPEEIAALLAANPKVAPMRRALIAETPQTRRHVPAFYLSTFELTNEQYEAFLSATGHASPRNWGTHGAAAEDALEPVVNVTYADAQDYCRWAGMRLPSEVEFQRAARAETKRPYPWGAEAPDARLAAVRVPTQRSEREPVGSHPAGVSPYGIHDLSGNAWEWTTSPYVSHPRAAEDPVEADALVPSPRWDASRRIVVGGSWLNDGVAARIATRRPADPSKASDGLGFRPAASVSVVGFDVARALFMELLSKDEAALFAPEHTVGIERWTLRAGRADAPEGYAVVENYDYLVFVPIAELDDAQDVTFRKGTAKAPLTIGYLSTTLQILRPALAPGTYQVTLQALTSTSEDAEDAQLFSFRRVPTGEQTTTVRATMSEFGKGDVGGEITDAAAPQGEDQHKGEDLHKLRLTARLASPVRKRIWPLTLELEVAAGTIGPSWRR